MVKLSIEAIRTQGKFSQEEMANLIGVSRPTYIKKEKGESKFTADELLLISDLCKVPLDFFEVLSEKD